METKITEVYCIEESNEKEESTKKSRCHVNKEMVRFKAHFFLFVGAMGCVLTYIPVIARDRLNLSATALAAILTAQQFVTVLSKPIIGYIADYFNKLKLIISALIIIQTVFLFLILITPPLKQPSITSAMSEVSEHFNDDKDIEFIFLTIEPRQNCENSILEGILSNPFTTVESMELTDRHSKSDIVCVGQFNESALFCFLKDVKQDNSEITFQTERNYCCSTVSSQLRIYNDSENAAKNHFHLSSIEPNLSFHNLNKTFPCKVVFSKDDSRSRVLEQPVIDDFKTYEFWLFALIYSVGGICTSSLFTLADTACFESIQKHGGDFGRQRLYGAAGWGTMASVGGILCDYTNDFLAAWILMAVLQILTLWNISKLDLVKPHFSQNILKDFGTVLKSVEFLAFELGVFMNGMGAGIMWFYLVWFITGLGGSKFLCGFVQYVQCFIGEIPFMFFSGWIIKRLGHFNLISLALVSYSIRFLWYSYLQNPWLVLPFEIAHGFTYGTFYPTVASYGKLTAKPGTEATTQSVLFTTHEGLGAGMGCVLAGMGFDYYGAHWTFFYTALFGFSATLLNILNTFLTRRRTKVLNIPPASSNG